MKRTITSLLILAVMSCAAFSTTVQAHVLKASNGVSAVMHVKPFDAPVSNEKTRVEFQFGSGFSLAQYATTLSIMSKGKQVASHSIEPAYFGTATLGIADITFPKAGVYNLIVSGKPKNTAAAFTMDFSLRVAAGKNAAAQSNNAGIVIAVGTTMFVIFLMFAVKQVMTGGRYKQIK